MLKKIIAFTIFTMTLTCAAVSAADYDGYIVEIAENTPARVELASAEYTGAEKVIDNMYLVGTLEEAESFVDEKYIVNICPNFEFELHDDAEYFAPPNDQYFDQQWGLIKTNMPYAWKTGLDGEGAKIAIIDSGIDLNHEDLIDAKITDVYNMFDETNPDDVTDNYFHGTAVAGIIAAQRNNGIGVAGIADKAELAIIKITDGKGSKFDLSSVMKAVDKAVEFNCDIANMSLGSTGILDDDEKQRMEKMLNDAADSSVTKNGKELILIASAGNNGTNIISYPAGFDNVIGVASVDENYNRSRFSQYNESVFITAPGNNIVVAAPDYIQTTTPGGTNTGYNKYISGNGTSFSAPFISATAALAVQAAHEADEEITIDGMKDIFKESTDDLGAEGWDNEFGYGVINMKKFVGVLHDEYNVALPEPYPTTSPIEYPTPAPEKLIRKTVIDYDREFIDTTIVNGGAPYENINIISVLYDDNGNLVKLQIADEHTIDEYTECGFDISDVSRTVKEHKSTYKMFLWRADSENGIVPLTSVLVHSIDALYTPSPTDTPEPDVTEPPEPDTDVTPQPDVTAEPSAPSEQPTSSPQPDITAEPSAPISSPQLDGELSSKKTNQFSSILSFFGVK